MSRIRFSSKKCVGQTGIHAALQRVPSLPRDKQRCRTSGDHWNVRVLRNIPLSRGNNVTLWWATIAGLYEWHGRMYRNQYALEGQTLLNEKSGVFFTYPAKYFIMRQNNKLFWGFTITYQHLNVELVHPACFCGGTDHEISFRDPLSV